MQTRHTLTRVTLGAALLSAFVLAQPAHAGLLGGGGSLGGGLGGGLGGSLGHRTLDIGGTASGQGQASQAAKLPRADKKAAEAADAGIAKATDKKDAAVDRADAARDKTQAAAGRSTSAELSKSASASTQPRSATADANGTGQISRGERSVSVGGSAQGSVARTEPQAE